MQLLLEKGAKVDTESTYGRTPLSFAAGNGHEAVVQQLLEKDAEVDPKDGSGPLSSAENGHEAVVQLLLHENYGTILKWGGRH